MDLRTLILITTLLTAVLSGCISAKEEDPHAPDEPDASAQTAEETPAPPIPQVKEIYGVSWVGQRVLDESFPVPDGYDHVATRFWNTGQLLGHPVVETGDGTAMDDPFSSFTGGVSHLFRLMPATPGTAHIAVEAAPAVDGAVLGVGGFSATAVSGAVPGELLELGWTGQRLEPAVLETEIKFYVPASVETFSFRISGTGQTLLGFQLYDPDGEEMLTYGPSNGPQSDTYELEGQEGLWTVAIEGITNGVWSLHADTVVPEPTPLDR